MASMIGSTNDTVQHEYISNRQDSYQIRVSNVKEDSHKVMITTATRSADFQGAASNVACGAMWNAVGHEEWKEMVRRKKSGIDSADGAAWLE